MLIRTTSAQVNSLSSNALVDFGLPKVRMNSCLSFLSQTLFSFPKIENFSWKKTEDSFKNKKYKSVRTTANFMRNMTKSWNLVPSNDVSKK
jgi:hypothetical protein